MNECICVRQVLALEYNMEKPKQFVGLFGLFNIGMAVIMSLYTLVGVFGYLKYGSSIQASITLNLPYDQKSVPLHSRPPSDTRSPFSLHHTL